MPALQALVLVASLGLGSARDLPEPGQPKPDHTDYARTARWLVHWNTYGVLSTSSHAFPGFPYGSLVSFADGPENYSTGRLLFYLTELDAAASDARVDPNVSLTVAQAALPGSCDKDPEDPTCAKVTILGTLEPVEGKADIGEAQQLLFLRHPEMRSWPAGHKFRLYELHIQQLRLLDWYGGAHAISPDDYFAVDLWHSSGTLATRLQAALQSVVYRAAAAFWRREQH